MEFSKTIESNKTPNKAIRTVTALSVAAGSFILASCGTSNSHSTPKAEVSHSTTHPNENGAECVTTGDIYKESANTNYVVPEAMFPALYKLDKHGKQNLVSTSEALSSLRERICTDTRSLAIVSYIQQLRETKQLPGQDALDRINQLNTSFVNSPDAAKNAEIQASAFLAFLTPTKNFAVTKGQATEIAAVRQGKNVVGLKGITVNTTGSLNGFEVGFNQVDGKLTPEQSALDAKLQSLILFASDGTVIFNDFIGPTSINFQENAVSVNVNPDNSQSTIFTGPNGVKTTITTGPNGVQTITTQTPNGPTITKVISSGTGNSGSGSNGGGGSGSGNGTGNSGSGSNGGGGSTSTTSPEGSTSTTMPNTTTTIPETTTTTIPETTTTTIPETTTTTMPNTTTTIPETTTTTTPTKGTQPGCVPNPPYVICN